MLKDRRAISSHKDCWGAGGGCEEPGSACRGTCWCEGAVLPWLLPGETAGAVLQACM